MNHLKNFAKLVVAILLFQSHCFAYSGGNGTEANPFQIANPNDLQELMNDSLNWTQHFIQTNDIDCTTLTDPKPIGVLTKRFEGSFDGDNFTISNLTIQFPAMDNVGLFGISSSAIKNLNLIDCNITGRSLVGGLCGHCNGNITNCYVSGEVHGIGKSVGGLVGEYDKNEISNCKSEANVKCNEIFVGGLIGSLTSTNNSQLIINSSSAGNVEGKNYVGGLIGYCNSKVKLSDLNSSANVKGREYVGGLIGYTKSQMENCYSTGNVEAIDYAGGLIGGLENTTVENCYSTGNMIGKGICIGGFCGVNLKGNINNSYATGHIEGNDTLGGFCGINIGNINECYTESISVIGKKCVGGFCGSNLGIIDNCSSKSGSVTGDKFVGGFCGDNLKGFINKCNSEVDVLVLHSYAGGFCGTNNANISFCFSKSNVICNGNISGGFCGNNDYMITNCYSTGSINGNDTIGGFSGINTWIINSSYSIGLVNGQGNSLGGFCGINSIGDLNYCYWDTQTSGISTSSGGEGRNTSEMKYLSNYPFWNFNVIWSIKPDEYPEFGDRHYYSGGDGSEANPWRISNTDDLEYLMNYYYDWNTHFILTESLDCSTIYLQHPIGKSELLPFSGSFNGSDNSISNLNMNYPKNNNVGFFGYIWGKINSLKFNNCSTNGNNFVGILCGINNGNITNCNINDCIITGANNIGGLSGSNYRYIENSTVLNSKIDGFENVGGFCGSTSNKIINSSSDCDVNGNNNVGGFCGVNSRNITNSSSVSNIIGNENVGGFCGMNNEGDILYSIASGEVKGQNSNVGGFCGLNYAKGRWVQIHKDFEYINAYTSMSKCFSSCKVEGDGDNTGGFIGQIAAFTHGIHDINNCYSESEIITKGNDVGGFIEHIDIENGGSGIDIDNCYSVGPINVSGTGNGGFIGYKNSVSTIKINNCYWDIETSGLDSSKGGTGKSTLDMYNQSTFERWNFDSIWYMPPNDYPKLHPYKLVSVDDNVVVIDSKFMSIYPNPTTDIFKIEYNLPESGQIYFEIYDILGNRVYNFDAGYKFSGINNEIVNISFLPTGSYSLVLKIENMIFTKKVIKIN